MGHHRRFELAFSAFLVFFAVGCPSFCAGQIPAPPTVQGRDAISTDNNTIASLPGAINGTVLDQSGAVVAGAEVRLVKDQVPSQQSRSGENGQFFFSNVPPGPFQLKVSSPGFTPQVVNGNLGSGETDTLAAIVLGVAEKVTEVNVGVPTVEIAEEQIKVEEKQRILGALPNFYVTYVPNAAPLNARQKFELAWKSTIDPLNFVIVGGIAGVQQAQNHFKGYGQGVQGYAKRFGADYADNVTGTFIGGAVLASVFKQDPRYFYKGTGSKSSRAAYAVAMSVICKGDNGRWQLNYSGILGSLAAGGISNLYYPEQDRDGFTLTFENAAIGIGANAITNVLQEFVIRKFTPHTHKAESIPTPQIPMP